jgi:hypothetical protein
MKLQLKLEFFFRVMLGSLTAFLQVYKIAQVVRNIEHEDCVHCISDFPHWCRNLPCWTTEVIDPLPIAPSFCELENLSREICQFFKIHSIVSSLLFCQQQKEQSQKYRGELGWGSWFSTFIFSSSSLSLFESQSYPNSERL